MKKIRIYYLLKLAYKNQLYYKKTNKRGFRILGAFAILTTLGSVLIQKSTYASIENLIFSIFCWTILWPLISLWVDMGYDKERIEKLEQQMPEYYNGKIPMKINTP